MYSTKSCLIGFRSTEATCIGSNFTICTTSPVSGHSNVWIIAALAGLVLATLVLGQLFGFMLSSFLTTANRRLYNQMFDVVLRAPMHFFETNPVGELSVIVIRIIIGILLSIIKLL